MKFGSALRLLTVMVLWALCFPLITIALDRAPHIAFAAMRGALAGVSLLALGVSFRRPIPKGGRTWVLIAVIGLGSTTLGFLGMFHAAEYVSPGLATVIANAQPLFAAFLAHAFLGERLQAIGKASLVAGFAGIVAIAWQGLFSGSINGYTLGIAYITVAALGVAVGNVAMKHLSAKVDPTMAMGFQLLLGAVPLFLVSVLTEDFSSFAWSTEFLVVLVVLSIFGTSLAFWLWFIALKEVDLNRANAFTFLVPIFGLAIGVLLFGERLDWIQAAGVMLVLAGIALVLRDASAVALQERPADLSD